MDKEMNDVMKAIIAFQEKCSEENIDHDGMETILLDILDSCGINFSR